MAKKGKTAKKSKAKKKVAPKKRTARPRSQALPGMESVRSQRLDNICEGIAEERESFNAHKFAETGLIQSALQDMVAKGIQVYKHGGIELARVPGAEKLRVRMSKDHGDAGVEDLEPADETVDDAGGTEEEG